MKVIDLLNKIANGEKVPKKVKYKTYYWEYKQESKDYKDNEDDWVFSCSNYDIPEMLNVEVEILEGEKKIPEKLDVISWDKCFHGVTHKEKELAIEINKTQELLNQVIDYLKSKGE